MYCNFFKHVLLEAQKGLNNMIFVGNVVIFCDYLFNLISKKFGFGSPREKKKKREGVKKAAVAGPQWQLARGRGRQGA